MSDLVSVFCTSDGSVVVVVKSRCHVFIDFKLAWWCWRRTVMEM